MTETHVEWGVMFDEGDGAWVSFRPDEQEARSSADWHRQNALARHVVAPVRRTVTVTDWEPLP